MGKKESKRGQRAQYKSTFKTRKKSDSKRPVKGAGRKVK